MPGFVKTPQDEEIWEKAKTLASKILKIDSSSISNCALGKRKTAGGYIWSYNESCIIPIKTNNEVSQYSLDGTLIKTYKNLETAAKDLKLNSRTAIKNCFIGKQKQAYGYLWKKHSLPNEAKELGLSESRLKN